MRARATGGAVLSSIDATVGGRPQPAPDAPRREALSYLLRTYPVMVIATVCMAAITALVPIAFILTTTYLATSAVENGAPSSHLPLTSVVLALAALVVVLQATTVLRQALTEALGRRLDIEFRDRLADLVSRPAGVGHLEGIGRVPELDAAMGVMNRLGGPAGGLLGLVGQASALVSGVACVVLIAQASALGGIAVVVFCGLAAVFMRLDLGRSTAISNLTKHQLRRVEYIRDLIMRPGTEKEIHVFGAGDWLGARHRLAWRTASDTAWTGTGGYGRSAVAAPAAVVACVFAAFCSYHAWSAGTASFYNLVAALQAVIAVVPFMLVSEYDRLATVGWGAVSALRDTAARLDTEPSRTIAGTRHDASGTKPTHDIVFSGVTFGYPGGPSVIEGLDLRISGGRTTAIVGENGAGKSTILALLARFYEPTRGSITWDGRPISDIAAPQWRRMLSTVMQRPMELALSLAENVSWGSPGEPDKDLMEEVARKTGLAEVIDALPDGWDTVLTRQISGGVDLSGGQWQKVGLARGLYAIHTGAEILTLDEPTASMDIHSERQVYETIMKESAGRTIILVSHRFATVRKADHIVVLGSGHVIEQGSHDELMAIDGQYRKMFTIQSEMHR